MKSDSLNSSSEQLCFMLYPEQIHAQALHSLHKVTKLQSAHQHLKLHSLVCTVGTPSSCSLTVIYHSLIKAPHVARATGSADGSHLQTRNSGCDEERCQIRVKDLQLRSGEINTGWAEHIKILCRLKNGSLQCTWRFMFQSSLKSMQCHCQDICTFMAHEVKHLSIHMAYTQPKSVAVSMCRTTFSVWCNATAVIGAIPLISHYF